MRNPFVVVLAGLVLVSGCATQPAPRAPRLVPAWTTTGLANPESILLADGGRPMRAGDLLVAPADVPHGVRNTGAGRLVVLAILAPGPR